MCLISHVRVCVDLCVTQSLSVTHRLEFGILSSDIDFCWSRPEYGCHKRMCGLSKFRLYSVDHEKNPPRNEGAVVRRKTRHVIYQHAVRRVIASYCFAKLWKPEISVRSRYLTSLTSGFTTSRQNCCWVVDFPLASSIILCAWVRNVYVLCAQGSCTNHAYT